jgi:hypothetical protein
MEGKSERGYCDPSLIATCSRFPLPDIGANPTLKQNPGYLMIDFDDYEKA